MEMVVVVGLLGRWVAGVIFERLCLSDGCLGEWLLVRGQGGVCVKVVLPGGVYVEVSRSVVGLRPVWV